MRVFTLLWNSLNSRLDLDTRWSGFRGWLNGEDANTQRLATVAGSLIFLSLVILLLTTCDGGLQIDP